MPFCSQCGNQVRDADAYCTRCGARQPVSAPSAFDSASEAISDKTSVVLCYVPLVGWIASIIVLASSRFRENRLIRFHAFQGLYLFVAWLLADRVVSPALRFSMVGPMLDAPGWAVRLAFQLVELLIVGVGVYMMFKATDREMLRLPVLGDLAEKSL
jgi:uncharacterized membrane protein